MTLLLEMPIPLSSLGRIGATRTDPGGPAMSGGEELPGQFSRGRFQIGEVGPENDGGPCRPTRAGRQFCCLWGTKVRGRKADRTVGNPPPPGPKSLEGPNLYADSLEKPTTRIS
jgi:hypothetical protein